MLKGSDPDRSKSHIRDPTDAAATARESDPPVLRAGLPTTPFGFRNRTGVRGFFPGDRRYPGCGGEQAGAPRVDSYPNARSRPTGSRTPPPTRRAVVAGIRDEVLVWSPLASLVLIRSRRARGQPAPRELPFRTPQPRKLGVQIVDGLGGRWPWHRGWRHGFRRCRQEGAAGSLVAAVGPSAAGAQGAHLLWGFVDR